jgi:hypothetical protein
VLAVASSTAANPTAGHQIQLRSALLAGACVVLPGFVTLALLGSLRQWRAREGEPPSDSQLLDHGLYLPSWFGVAAFAAAAAWAATVLALSGGPVHLPLLASPAAVVVFTFAVRTLLSTTVLLQMLKPTVGQIALCFAAAVSTALGAFWFISMGIWQGSCSAHQKSSSVCARWVSGG